MKILKLLFSYTLLDISKLQSTKSFLEFHIYTVAILNPPFIFLTDFPPFFVLVQTINNLTFPLSIYLSAVVFFAIFAFNPNF